MTSAMPPEDEDEEITKDNDEEITKNNGSRR